MVLPLCCSAGFYPIKCALGLSFYEQSTGTVVLPLLLFLSFALLEAPLARRAGVGLAAYKSTLMTCAVLVAYLLYPSVVEAVLTGMCLPCSSPCALVPTLATYACSFPVPRAGGGAALPVSRPGLDLLRGEARGGPHVQRCRAALLRAGNAPLPSAEAGRQAAVQCWELVPRLPAEYAPPFVLCCTLKGCLAAARYGETKRVPPRPSTAETKFVVGPGGTPAPPAEPDFPLLYVIVGER